MNMACVVFCGQPGRSAARKSDAYSLAPVTLATPSMRPTPVAAGFHACRPGKVSRAAKLGSSAIAKRDTLRAMPLAVTDLTNSRREILMMRRLSLPEPELWTSYSGIRCRTHVRVQRRSPEEVSAGTESFGLREDRPMSLRPGPG